MNTMKTTALMAGMTVLFVLVGRALGGESGMVLAFVMAAATNLGAYWFSDKLVLMMYRARPVTRAQAPDLHDMVSDLALKAGVPMPKLYIIPEPSPNAFATGRDPRHAAVAVTEGILETLNSRELRGVLAHELGHVVNRDILISTIAATMAGAISMLANMAHWGMMLGGRGHEREDRGGHPIAALIAVFLAPLAAMLIQMAISRSREFLADETGSRLHGDPLDLASALKKISAEAKREPMDAQPATAHLFIVNPLMGGGLMSLFSTHPPLRERVRRLEALARA
ncbi:MAG: zinc metalloprotease HtpX [Elusimicrobia bacterium]|nr:zinc metalloprotease HtpX [Elusimicrobiota bacterium]